MDPTTHTPDLHDLAHAPPAAASNGTYQPEPPPISPAVAAPAAPSTGVGTRRLLGLLAAVALIAITPSLVGQIAYQVRYNELLAGVDVADQGLKGLKSRLSDFELTSRLISKRLEPSVVSIFRPGPRGREGQGSGVIVDKAGYIVTNYHVVRGARKIEVQLSDGRRAPVTDVKTDEMTDLAVLKIDLPDLVAAEWGDSDQLEVGDLVWAVGSPFGLDRSVTFGIVSAKARRSGSRLTTNLYQEYLQTDAAVNPGNSGGPLINIEGKIVGINAAIFGPAYQGISFAIPSSVAHEQYTQLRDKGWIERAWLGIRPESVPPNVQERLGLSIGEGVYVNHVEEGAPAGRAGIQAGDVILQWNDFEATDATLLSRAIAATKVGSKATVRLVRGQADPEGEPQRTQLQFEVDVERHPESISPKDDRR